MAIRDEMMKLRKIEAKVDNSWNKVKMKDLKRGQEFRMFEPDDGPLVGSRHWIARSKPELSEDNVWSIQADPCEEINKDI